MATVKGKQKMGVNSVSEAGRIRGSVGGGSFKVYSETEKVKVDASSIRNPVTVSKAAGLASAKDTKETLNKMENNSKSKGVNSAYTKVGRKALVDVSNIPGNIARSVVHDGSKHTKGEKSAIVKRVSVRSGIRTVNVSRKSFTGKVSETQAARDVPTSKKDDQQAKTKVRGRESILADRRSSRIPLVPTRKSLPVLKRMNQADTSRSKESAESSEKAKDSIGFSVKAKLGKKVVYRLSNSKNQFWRNRASDGFMISNARGQNKVDAPPSSKNSVKPNGKTTSMASNARGTLKSKIQSGANKPISVAAISSKKVKEVVRSSISEDIPSMVSQAAQEKPSFDGKTNANINSSDIVAKRKSNRRRSYTSLLMASSKLLEGNGEVVGQEKLPSIDDDCNQLDVAEYVDEIYQYYWVMEAQNPLPENCMSIQTDVTPHMRGILINWLIEVHFKFELMPETLYLMVTLLDRYLSQVKIKKNEMQLVGLTALLLASKYEDFWHPRIKDLISISAESYTRDQMLGMEKLMLKTLKFRLNMPTPYVFMLRFLKAAQSDSKLEHLAFYLIELSLIEYEALKFKPSLLCASAIYVARCTLRMTPVWTPLLGKHAHYDVSQIRDCAEMILRVQKAAKSGKLRVTYEKYTNPDLSGVAAIKPLDSLPS